MTSTSVKAFDFRATDKFLQDYSAGLNAAHARTAKLLEAAFSETFSRPASVSVAPAEQQPYAEYADAATATPALYAAFSVQSVPGTVVARIPAEIALLAVDVLLGGAGTPVAARPLTVVEADVAASLAGRVAVEYAATFQRQPSDTRVHLTVDSLPSSPPDAQVIVTGFSVDLDGHAFEVSLCLSGAFVQSAFAGPAPQREPQASDPPSERIAELLASVEVELVVEFSPVMMPSAEVLSLSVGDVIPLDTNLDEPLTASVSGTPLFKVRPARNGKRLTCQVLGTHSPDPGNERG